MKFEREHYIEKLISSKHNHLIKIVTLVALHLMLEYKPIILLQGIYCTLLSLFFVGQLTRYSFSDALVKAVYSQR